MSSPPTVLLADDSLTIQRVVSLTFADQPVRVVVAKDGQDAINRMESERPDLVLADTNMPCVDGYELARWVRGQPHLSMVPVLLLAGVTDPVDEQRLHDSGANGVLEKPFEPSHVISRVKELLGLKGAPPAATGRLVTTPDVKPPAPPPARRPGSSPSHSVAAVDRPLPAAEPAAKPEVTPAPDSRPTPDSKPGVSLFRSAQGPAPEETAADGGRSGELHAFDMEPPVGNPADWFPDDSPVRPRAASLAEEFGLRASEPPAPADGPPAAPVTESPASAPAGAAAKPASVSSAADVFESLLAAEQGGAGGPVLVQAAPELTPAALDEVSARVADRLRPDLERMSDGVRAAMGETVRAALNDAIAGAVPGAIEQYLPASVERTLGTTVASLVRETVARQVEEAVVPVIRDIVREVAEIAVRSAVADAVAAAVPAAVLDAVRGDGDGEMRILVRETAERLVTEEIARIRQRRG